jgi:hypothetical protein
MPQYQIQIQLNTGRSHVTFSEATIVMDGAKEFRLSREGLDFDSKNQTVLVVGPVTHFTVGKKIVDLSVPGAHPARVHFLVELPAAAATLRGTVVQLSEPAGDYSIEVKDGGAQTFEGVVKNRPFSINLH